MPQRALSSRAAALSRSVSPALCQPTKATEGLPFQRAERSRPRCWASLFVTSSVEICSTCGGKRPTVPTRASRKAFLFLLTSSLANCPVAVYSVLTASSSLFDISPTQSFVISLTEINVGEEPLFLYRLF